MEDATMKKRGKIALGVVIAILVIIGIALYLVWSNLGSLVASAIEDYGSQATGTSVTVGKVDISLGTGTAKIDNLTINNPQGYQSNYAAKFRTIKIGLDVSSLRTNTIVMNEAIVDGASVNAELKGTQSNLMQILDNLKHYAGPSKPSQQSAGAQKKFIIKTFRFTNGQVTALVDAANAKRVINIPNISLHDIGVKSGGVDGAELARQILRPIIEKVLEQARTEAAQKALDVLKKKGQETLQEKLKDLGG
jgi:uncharacterized protein involved in outer membrane biogenesis